MINCKRCGGETVKAGFRIHYGGKKQIYLCKNCGYEFWEGQKLQGKHDVSVNPLCPKCQASTQKYGYGFKAGEKVRKYRCSSCGYMFLGKKTDIEI